MQVIYTENKKATKTFAHSWYTDQPCIGGSLISENLLYDALKLTDMYAKLHPSDDAIFDFVPKEKQATLRAYFLDDAFVTYKKSKQTNSLTIIGSKKAIHNAARTLELPLEDLI